MGRYSRMNCASGPSESVLRYRIGTPKLTKGIDMHGSNGSTKSKHGKSQQQFIDIIRDAKRFHDRLSEAYSDMSKIAGREKVQLLLEHLSARQKYLVECLDEYERNSNSRALVSWFKYAPNVDEDVSSIEAEFSPEMDVDDVAELVWKSDEKLLGAVRDMRSRAVPETLQESLDGLVALLERDKAHKMSSGRTD